MMKSSSNRAKAVTSDGRTEILTYLPWEDGKMERMGWRGIVYKVKTPQGIFCLKKKRGKVPTNLRLEAEMLHRANRAGIGPKLVGYDKKEDSILMEWIDGTLLGDWMLSAKPKDIKRVVTSLLNQAKKLDSVGIRHGELSTAPKNILVGRKPVILDFGKSRMSENPKNYSALYSYLVSNPRGIVANRVRDALKLSYQKTSTDVLRSLASSVA